MYDLSMLVVHVYYMNNSVVVVVPTSGRVTRSFVRSFVHTMTTAHDDDGTRRNVDERRHATEGNSLGEVRAGRVDARERVGWGTGRR